MIESARGSNSIEVLTPLVADDRIPMRRVWGMLALRSVLTLASLLALAAVFALAGRQGAVAASAAWWLWFVTAANVACLALMATFGRLEGVRLRDIFFASSSTWRGDVIWALVALAGTAVLAMLPGTLLAGALWGDASHPNALLFQALPLMAVYPLFVLMPIFVGRRALDTCGSEALISPLSAVRFRPPPPAFLLGL
jgi:hypothetical protein